MDLVVYYSRTNNTKEVSEIIAQQKNAQTLEIKDKKSRSGPIGYAIGAVDSFMGKKTKIEYDSKDLSEFDTVYVGSPVWASKATPAVIEFIEENDFNGTDVVSFVTLMGSGGESALDHMNKAIQEKGGNIKNSFAFRMTGNDIKQLVLDALNDE